MKILSTFLFFSIIASCAKIVGTANVKTAVNDLLIASGNIQVGTVDSLFSQSLTVKLTSADDQSANQNIIWASTSGGQLITPTSKSLTTVTTKTDATGISSINFNAPTAGGSYTVTASWNDSKQVEFTLVGISATQSRAVKILTGVSGNTSVVSAANLTIGTTYDYHCALFNLSSVYQSDATCIWHTQGWPAQNANDLNSGSATAVTVGEFIPTTVGQLSLTALYQGTDSTVVSTIGYTPNLIVDTAGTPTTLTLAAGSNNQLGTVHQALGNPFVVKVKDQYGRNLQGASVVFSVVGGGGNFSGSTSPVTVTTNATGDGSISGSLDDTAGVNVYRAALATNTAIYADISATGSPGAPANLIFTRNPSGTYAGIPFVTPPIVTVQDSYSNVVTAATGSVVLSVQTGAGTLSGAFSVTPVNGVATFTNVIYSAAGAGVVLRATLAGGGGNSSPFTVLAAPPGACQVNDAYFTTASGGCKDLNTSLVWSSLGPSLSRHDAVWDTML